MVGTQWWTYKLDRQISVYIIPVMHTWHISKAHTHTHTPSFPLSLPPLRLTVTRGPNHDERYGFRDRVLATEIAGTVAAPITDTTHSTTHSLTHSLTQTHTRAQTHNLNHHRPNHPLSLIYIYMPCLHPNLHPHIYSKHHPNNPPFQ